MGLMRMDHEIDPKKEILDRVWPFLDSVQVIGDDVLLGVYMRPERTAGGLILAQSTRQEDEYQGLACLVLKMGNLAFKEDENHHYDGIVPKVGDWVAVRKSEGFSFKLGKDTKNVQPCRIMSEKGIRLIISEPDTVW